MGKQISIDITIIQKYVATLEKTIRDLNSIIHEYDHEFMNNTTNNVPQDIRFDSVPLVRKMKDAHKEALLLVDIYSKKTH